MNLFFLAQLVGLTFALELSTVAEPVANRYIIQFKKNIAENLRKEHIAKHTNATILHEYDFSSFQGYAAEMSKTELSIALNSDIVEIVEQDGVVRASACTTQSGSTWGLVRTSQENLNINGNYYYENTLTGTGIRAYVIDTGIYCAHNDFGNRCVWGTNTVDNSNSDGNGHGTHVAGTIGGTTYGLAKGVTLVAVKVLNAGGSGTTAGVIAGVNWVVNDVNKHHEKAKYGKKAPARGVSNMSLGGGRSTTMNNAVNAMVEAEVVSAVAAGNDYSNACNYSPASAELAIGTGASGNTDAMAYFSNYGTCVDIFAPGLSITAPWIGNPNADNTISGTSMAAPHVAGIAVKLIAQHPDYDADKIKDEMISIATMNKLTGIGSGSPNRLSYHYCL